jgi:hypothetical protein
MVQLRYLLMLALCLGVALAAPCAAAVIYHNGLVGSTPPGDGQVNVAWNGASSASAWQTFLAPDAFLLLEQFDTPSVQAVILTVQNGTAESWVGFAATVLGADLSDMLSTELAPEVNPVELNGSTGNLTLDLYPITGSLTVAGSVIVRTAADASLTIAFGDPVDPGESFMLICAVRDTGEPGLPGVLSDGYALMYQAVVPEPTTLAMIVIGPLLWRRRRG